MKKIKYVNINGEVAEVGDHTALSKRVDIVEKSLYREELVAYGIEFDTTISTPDCTRIGNMSLHRTLPVHNLMRGCLLDDDGNVVKYLNPSDWTGEVRDGSMGQVMVELPEYWRKFETDGTKRRVWLSTAPIAGYHRVPKKYVSAYEATVQRSTLKLSSVVNTDADYRGGNNNADWDGTYKTLLGKCATRNKRTDFRTYARNRKAGSTKWNCMVYGIQKDLYWLFVTEYATLDTQAEYNAQKTAEGFAQGGLGMGVTLLEAGLWNVYNNYNPVIPCGYTDELGNGTGYIDYTMPEEYTGSKKVQQVPRYRGIENLFGHCLQCTDGVNVRVSPNEENGGDGLSKVFVCDEPSKFNDTNYDGYKYIGNETRTNGFIKEVIFGEDGDIIPSMADGGSTIYHCDYHETNIPTTETLRVVLFGGNAFNNNNAGFIYEISSFDSSHVYQYNTSRLCFLPETA